MVMFTAHIAWILLIMAIAAGLVALHYGQQLNAKLIRWAGWLLVIFGIGGAACTGYYAIKYFAHGHYEHAYASGMPMMGMDGMMGKEGMQCCKKMQAEGKQCCPMCAKMMQGKMEEAPAAQPQPKADEHEQHH